MKSASEIEVALEVSVGIIEIAVYPKSAPASARAFLALVDDGSFTQYGAFYRAVRKNRNDHGLPEIDVIQGGLFSSPNPLSGVVHETTLETGIRHLDGTVSLARRAIGTASGAGFFICIGEQPALDAAGGRNSDGQGFAAFGRVTTGMEIVRMIHQLPTSRFATDPYLSGQILDPPVRIVNASRTSHQT